MSNEHSQLLQLGLNNLNCNKVKSLIVFIVTKKKHRYRTRLNQQQRHLATGFCNNGFHLNLHVWLDQGPFARLAIRADVDDIAAASYRAAPLCGSLNLVDIFIITHLANSQSHQPQKAKELTVICHSL